MYENETPGVEGLDNTTFILSGSSEPQPDGALIITDGNTYVNEEDFLVGSPELLAEISSSSESIDLHAERDNYERAGVKEYIVVAVRMKRVYWWIRKGKKFVDLAAGADGIYRSETFPGLWLDPAAFVKLDSRRVMAVLRKGLASPEHAVFVQKLSQGKARS
jgi:Uma2 family endonuclease